MNTLFEAANVTLESDWYIVLASKKNWLDWLAIARQKAMEDYEHWADLSGCCDEDNGELCKHLEHENIWCKLTDSPATVNPVLHKYGMSGMACCGCGKNK